MFETLLEGLVLVLILGVVIFLTGRSLYRTLKGGNQGCLCCGNRLCEPRVVGTNIACPTAGRSRKEADAK